MYFVAKLHPDLEHANSAHYTGLFLSEKEKRATIDTFYEEARGIPLSLDHRNCGRFGFIKPSDVIGQVLDLYNNERGDLMVKCVVSRDHPSYGEILAGCFGGQQRWGVSVGLAHGEDNEGRRAKRLVHVAFTPDPGFADYDTYLFRYHVNEDVLNARIATDFYKAGVGRSYAAAQFDEKLKRMHRFVSLRDFLSSRVGSQESTIVRILAMSNDVAVAEQPQATQPVNTVPTEQMQVEKAPIVAPKRPDLSAMQNLDTLDAIKRGLAALNAHMKDMAKLGHTWADFDTEFRETHTKLEKAAAEKEKFTNDYWQQLRAAGQVPVEKLDHWNSIATSCKPEEQDAREQMQILTMANASLLQEKLGAEKRKYEEELNGLRAQLEEQNKKVKMSTPQSAPSFSLPAQQQFQPQLQSNGQVNLVDAFSGRGAALGKGVFNNPEFNSKFFDPRAQQYEKPQNYTVSPEKAAIFSMMSNKAQVIDSQRY